MSKSNQPKHVREDGSVEDCVIETYFRACKAAAVEDDCIRIFIDEVGYDIETRLSFVTLERLGFRRDSLVERKGAK